MEGKCSGEILACRCEINHCKCPKLREVWLCWEKPTWPTPTALGIPQDSRAALSHCPTRKMEPQLVGFSHIWSKLHVTTQVLSAQASHWHWIREFWATSAPSSLSIPPQSSQQLSASQCFLNIPEHVSSKYPRTIPQACFVPVWLQELFRVFKN